MAHGLDQVADATFVAVRNGPGLRLRAAREARGATQLEIAQELRLHPDIIKRLEEDDYNTGLPLVFIKGYLRAFAGLVGVDPEQVIIEFTHLGLVDTVRTLPEIAPQTPNRLSNFQQESHQYRAWVVSGLIGVVVAGIFAFMWYQADDASVPAESTQLSVPLTIAPPEQIEAPQVEAAPAPAPQAAQAVETAPVRVAPVTQSVQPAAAPMAQAAEPATASAPRAAQVEPRRSRDNNPAQHTSDREEEAMLF